VELKLTRCTVRDWRMEDAPSLFKHSNNRNVSRTLRDRFPYPYTIEDAKEFLARSTSKEMRNNFCIEIDGAAVGGIGVHIGEDVHRHVASIGYWLGEEFWGQGVMSEVVPAFVNYCFATLPLHRIYAEAYENNPASARILEKAGFVLEGRLRKNVIKDGQILDSLLYAKTI
jgi:[ribosomal protein S5]-alanine N-acetyltransferase